MVVDVGTGSGHALLRRAAREPQTLFIGIDADARAMSEASRRVARPSQRGGTSNVIFLAAAAEALPGPLAGRAGEVVVALPWGSLLRATLGPDPALIAALTALLNASGVLELLLTSAERDAAAGGLVLDDGEAAVLAKRYAAFGLDVLEFRPATRTDVERLSSGWGARLGVPARRQAWLFRLRIS